MIIIKILYIQITNNLKKNIYPKEDSSDNDKIDIFNDDDTTPPNLREEKDF